MAYLPVVEIEPSTSADSAVIWLHGLGADGNDFAPLVPQLSLSSDRAVRFVFPHAPRMPVTVNGGYVMPAWYDIRELSLDRKIDVEQLVRSAEAISQLVERELERGIDSRRIVLAGFSQGGAVAYQAALSFAKPLGGLLVLSSYLATAETLKPHSANRQLPILIHHGRQDPVVPEILGRRAADYLSGEGYKPDYQTYDVEHGICPAQIPKLSHWLSACLKKS